MEGPGCWVTVEDIQIKGCDFKVINENIHINSQTLKQYIARRSVKNQNKDYEYFIISH